VKLNLLYPLYSKSPI